MDLSERSFWKYGNSITAEELRGTLLLICFCYCCILIWNIYKYYIHFYELHLIPYYRKNKMVGMPLLVSIEFWKQKCGIYTHIFKSALDCYLNKLRQPIIQKQAFPLCSTISIFISEIRLVEWMAMHVWCWSKAHLCLIHWRNCSRTVHLCGKYKSCNAAKISETFGDQLSKYYHAS